MDEYEKQLALHFDAGYHYFPSNYSEKLSKKFILKFLDKLYLNLIPIVYIKINNEYSWRTFL